MLFCCGFRFSSKGVFCWAFEPAFAFAKANQKAKRSHLLLPKASFCVVQIQKLLPCFHMLWGWGITHQPLVMWIKWHFVLFYSTSCLLCRPLALYCIIFAATHHWCPAGLQRAQLLAPVADDQWAPSSHLAPAGGRPWRRVSATTSSLLLRWWPWRRTPLLP
jgi:hypothetical protein